MKIGAEQDFRAKKDKENTNFDEHYDMCIECFDCNQVTLDAELYTIAAREK